MTTILLLLATVVSVDSIRHKGIYSGEVSDFEVTIPQKVSPAGDLLGSEVSHHHRTRRSTTRESFPETLHYRLMMAGEWKMLDLEPSGSFISPVLRVQRGRRSRRIPRDKTTCHYRGVVRHHRHSNVALSACNGLAGVLRLETAEYWLEPSTSGNTTEGRQHILFRRNTATRHRKRRKKKRKKKHEKNCGTREPPRLPAARLEWSAVSGVGRVQVQGRGRRRRLRQRRSVSKEHHVEALLVADTSMVEFHHDGDVEMYLLTIMNMVSALYQEPTIGNSVNIVVVRIVLIEDDASEGLNITIHADHALNSFCSWQQKINPASESDPQHHDVAILVTRKDICARQNTPCSTLGVAHVGGMCEPDRSCNINEDNGITLAHTIAHEMGHNFGMFHDSSRSGCSGRQGSTLHVMTPTFEADSLNIAWSECSRRDITHFLDQGSGRCLEDRPAVQDDYTYPELPPGAMYNADYQCRLQFGPDSTVCSPSDEICSRLWCTVEGMCTTNLYPAAPGTHCDKHMWCVNQACVSIGESSEPIAGGWGEWGEWSECSRSCGAGVSVRERLCDHPTPAFGGSYCLGERRRYRICNTQACPESSLSFRAEQCSSFDNEPYFGKNYTWLPYFETSEPCELHCTDTEDTIIASLGDARDGTPCNLGSRDMCISGICRKVGCDWVVDSNAEEDKCGVCHGDGKLCSTQNGFYNVTQGDGYTEVAIIPSGARNVRVEEVSSSRNYISIGSASGSTFYLNGNGEITIAGEYTIAGSAALYERNKDLEKLRIPGPIKEDILIYVIFRDQNPGLYFEFTMPNEQQEHTDVYRWELSDWSTCSATCGGGEQVSKAVCKETGKDMSVAAEKCASGLRPSDRMQTCNLHSCPTRWWIGPWQLCPVTCGELALRRRSVICVSGSGEKPLALPDSDCTGQLRPHDQEPCPDIPPCLPPSLLATIGPFENLVNIDRPKKFEVMQFKNTKVRYEPDKWKVLPWSQCSVTCGIGFKKRTIQCPSQKCDPRTKPISVKQCFRHCANKTIIV
ncbi:A disintegrin and metalloproteinase with thrombospondin motifs 7-like [Macrosteles quadrilineatus]|uniref:A disintegrin and metalloproteinase with thrombospondin motifs 7-like n=1 Tax=Macrosteles quadrilineatus TaxID=74068 RepID=UPI0023E22A01|nr:A disintegrin and metalloproteinase with thrombospondin motifs 7-like [Macrosteles quadrilineatus]